MLFYRNYFCTSSAVGKISTLSYLPSLSHVWPALTLHTSLSCLVLLLLPSYSSWHNNCSKVDLCMRIRQNINCLISNYFQTNWVVTSYQLSLTSTRYRPIYSLLGAIMKVFERVIEKRLRKHLEDNGFFSKYQSGFRKSKSTNDHLFRLSQTIMESFNRGEHVIAAFLDVEKAFDNVWHNGLRYKIYQLDLPTKLRR